MPLKNAPDTTAGTRIMHIGVIVVLAGSAGCSASGADRSAVAAPALPSNSPASAEGGYRELAAGITEVFPGTRLVSASPGTDGCPAGSVPVARMTLPEQVLFQPGRDELGPKAAGVLDFVTTSVQRDTPSAQMSVLAHTDPYGSDSYNIDLSRRRGESVMRALAARGLPPDRLSAVAIGKRQPVAGNDTPAGRAANRRIEFLIAPCLTANLEVIRQVVRSTAYGVAGEDPSPPEGPVKVMRLIGTGAGQLRMEAIDSITLRDIAGASPKNAGPAREPAH